MPFLGAMRGAAVALAVGVVAAAAISTRALEPLRRPIADALVRAAAARAPQPPASLPDVAVVAIDSRSLRAFPDWPWPRSLHARAIERLDAAGARAIAFDVDFSTPRDPGDDERFARAIAASGRVVLAGFKQTTRSPDGLEIEIANLPTPSIAAGAAAIGSVLVPVDADGVVRFAPRASEIAGERTPSLAAAALAVALGEPPDASVDARFRIDYRRSVPAIPVLSIAEVIEGRFDPRDVAGRAVLIGATAAEFQDLWSTPLGPAKPGVLIQALLLRTLAAERAGAAVLRAPVPQVEIALAFLLSAGAALLGAGSHVRRQIGLGLLALAVPACCFGALVVQGLLLDPLLPLGIVAAHYVLGLEGVRRRFGRRLAERELSLVTLHRVGETAAGSQDGGGLQLALALLGDVVAANGVALLRARPNGRLDGQRLEWRRGPGDVVGDAATAEAVLADRRTRVFEGLVPGRLFGPGVAVYAPLVAGDTAVGVLVVERDGPEPLDETQLRTIATVGAQLALSAENLSLISQLRATFDASVAAIASAVEARDGYTEAHCRRLAAFSVAMGERLRLPELEIEAIRLGALLHDVGKIGIRDEILLKPDRFSPDDRREMERHPDIGHRIIRPIPGLAATTLDCVRHHHERWDGTGYPEGLSGEAIPLGARIVAVVDVWDALSTERPYKRAYTPVEVRRLLEKGRGSHFDPTLLDLFFRILEEEGEDLEALLSRERSGPT